MYERRVYTKIGITGYDDDIPARAYLDKFYLHNRCLLFTSGIWMSETVGIPHALMYKPVLTVILRWQG